MWVGIVVFSGCLVCGCEVKCLAPDVIDNSWLHQIATFFLRSRPVNKFEQSVALLVRVCRGSFCIPTRRHSEMRTGMVPLLPFSLSKCWWEKSSGTCTWHRSPSNGELSGARDDPRASGVRSIRSCGFGVGSFGISGGRARRLSPLCSGFPSCMINLKSWFHIVWSL